MSRRGKDQSNGKEWKKEAERVRGRHLKTIRGGKEDDELNRATSSEHQVPNSTLILFPTLGKSLGFSVS